MDEIQLASEKFEAESGASAKDSAGQEASESSRLNSTVRLDQKPEPRRPLRFPNQGADLRGCGWIFHVDDVFNKNSLFDLLEVIRDVVRLKGVFRCESGWWTINRTKHETGFLKSTYRRDSRLEIIFESDLLNWDYLEESLVQCITN